MSESRLRAGEWRQGWPVVLGSAIGLGTGFSIWAYVSSTFVLPLGEAFGWSRGQIAGVAATGIVGAALAPALGMLVDRVGVRKIVLTSAAILGLLYLALSQMTGSLTLFYLLFTVLGIAGLGTIGITYTRAVAGWFEHGRGLALGVSLLGVSVSAVLLPPLLSAVMATYGWSAGFIVLAALSLLIGVPTAFLLIRERPEIVAAARVKTPWRSILADPVFWLLVVAILLVNIPGAGILGQFQPILVDGGLTRAQAAGMLSVYAGAVFVGRLAFGFLLDRFEPTIVAAIAFALPLLGAVFLLDGQVTAGEAMFAAAMLGVSAGAEIDIMGYFVARYFGLAHYSTLFGTMMSALVLANASGNILYGRLFDRQGNYQDALNWTIGGYVLGAAAILMVGKLAATSSAKRRQFFPEASISTKP